MAIQKARGSHRFPDWLIGAATNAGIGPYTGAAAGIDQVAQSPRRAVNRHRYGCEARSRQWDHNPPARVNPLNTLHM